MHQTHPSTRQSKRTRVLSLVLALALLLGLVPGLNLGGDGSAHWADSYLSQLVEWGFVRPDQITQPNDELTRADFMAITNRAYGYAETGPTPFEDIKETDWFYDDVEIAYTAKYIKGTSETTASPNDTLTRETAATILGRNMMLQESPGEILDFTDARDISFWSKGVIKTSLERYLVNGYDDGTFRPQKSVNWGEMAAMLTRIVGTPLQEAGDYSLGGVFGNVTITSPGVTLRDSVISGDLYITGGVGLGDIKLENVTVLGRIICSGTGEAEAGQASILLRNVTADELLIDNLQGKTVSVQADGITELGKTTVRTSAYIEDNTPEGLGLHTITLEGRSAEDEDLPPTTLTLAGRIEEVINKTPNSFVHVGKGTVGKLTIDEAATESQVTIDRNSEVKELNLDTATYVDGEGDIKNLNVNAPGCEVTILPENIYIRPGLTAIIAGEEMDSTAAEESNREPQILSGYPVAEDIAPTTITAAFATNKKGTVYWAVSPITDGSVSAEDLVKPPVYGGISVAHGSVSVPKADEEVRAAVTGLTPGGSYYLSALVVDDRGLQSPVKVISFSTPDNTIPAFCEGYPHMSTTSAKNGCQVVVMPTKSCNLYYALLPEGATAPTEDEFKTASVSGALGYGVVPVTKNTESVIRVDDVTLEEQKTYVLYLWLVDADGSNKGKIVSLTFTTDDETPPYFIVQPTVNKVQATSVGLTFRLSENGTVYWAVVPTGEEYPKKQPGHDTVNMSDEWAKLQVQNGYSALVSGRVQASVDRDGTITVSGLQPETSYDFYYVAQDTAGNYSVMVQKITINTLDENGPKIRQYFSKYDGTDETANPMPSTDIILEFTENVRYNGENGGEGFLELYKAYDEAQGATDKADALARLVTSVKGSITLWKEDSGTGQNVEVTPRYSVLPGEQNHTENANWGIDYEQVKIEMRDGKLLVTFPESGLRLDSGSTYYFTIHDLTDTSTAQNPLAPSTVDYQEASVALGHSVPKFTTVFADLFLSDPGVKNGDPYERRAVSSANAKPKKTDALPVASTQNVGILDPTHADPTQDATLATVDMHFQITPRSTKTVEDNVSYDVLIWTDTTCTYDLYYRIIDSNGAVKDGDKFYTDPTYTSDSVSAANKVPTRTGYSANDDNGWVYLGYSGDLNTTGGWVGKTVNGNFNQLGSSQFPALKNLSEDLRYEFAISLRSVKGSDARATWTGQVNMKVQVAAGWSSRLYSLSQGLDWNTTWPQFQESGVNGGAQSVGKDISGNFYFDIFQLFTDTRLPMFANNAPSFTTTSDSVTMSLALDRAGTIYYAIGEAQIATSNNRPAITTTYIDIGKGETDEKDVTLSIVPTSGSEEKTNADKYINDDAKATVTNPLNQYIFNPQNWSDALVAAATGNIVNPGGALSTPTVENLKPDTTYYAYFVLKGTAQEISKVYIYQFTTEAIRPPKIENLAPTSDGNATTQTDVNSIMDYRLFYTTDIQNINLLNEQLASHLSSDASSGGGLPTVYQTADGQPMTLLKAMITPFDATRATDGYVPLRNGVADITKKDYSVFDIYADAQTKRQVYDMILLGRTSNAYGNEVQEPDEGHNIRITGSTPTTLNLKNVYPGSTYIILTMARNQLSDENGQVADNYSFRAAENIGIIEAEAPKLISVIGNTTQPNDTSVTNPTFHGSFVLTFDKPIYWKAGPQDQYYPASGGVDGVPTTSGSTRNILGGAMGNPSGGFTASTNSTPPTMTFTVSFNQLTNGSSLIIPARQICNASGNATEEQIEIVFKLNRTTSNGVTTTTFIAETTCTNSSGQKRNLGTTTLYTNSDSVNMLVRCSDNPSLMQGSNMTLSSSIRTAKMEAIINPDSDTYSVTWESSDSNVVTVNRTGDSNSINNRTATLTAVGIGTARVTVSVGGGVATYVINVTVTSAGSTFTLAPTTLTLSPGEVKPVQLTITNGLPNTVYTVVPLSGAPVSNVTIDPTTHAITVTANTNVATGGASGVIQVLAGGTEVARLNVTVQSASTGVLTNFTGKPITAR